LYLFDRFVNDYQTDSLDERQVAPLISHLVGGPQLVPLESTEEQLLPMSNLMDKSKANLFVTVEGLTSSKKPIDRSPCCLFFSTMHSLSLFFLLLIIYLSFFCYCHCFRTNNETKKLTALLPTSSHLLPNHSGFGKTSIVV
jgi:hypothetical protein